MLAAHCAPGAHGPESGVGAAHVGLPDELDELLVVDVELLDVLVDELPVEELLVVDVELLDVLLVVDVELLDVLLVVDVELLDVLLVVDVELLDVLLVVDVVPSPPLPPPPPLTELPQPANERAKAEPTRKTSVEDECPLAMRHHSR